MHINDSRLNVTVACHRTMGSGPMMRRGVTYIILNGVIWSFRSSWLISLHQSSRSQFRCHSATMQAAPMLAAGAIYVVICSRLGCHIYNARSNLQRIDLELNKRKWNFTDFVTNLIHLSKTLAGVLLCPLREFWTWSQAFSDHTRRINLWKTFI